mmetsp:Transcript_18322/g.50523  ORF Transcript_18322/g.50523 Transcript_18322/m.50523 type:complete len:221 (+) Transcript_18322:185-847(+)
MLECGDLLQRGLRSRPYGVAMPLLYSSCRVLHQAIFRSKVSGVADRGHGRIFSSCKLGMRHGERRNTSKTWRFCDPSILFKRNRMPCAGDVAGAARDLCRFEGRRKEIAFQKRGFNSTSRSSLRGLCSWAGAFFSPQQPLKKKAEGLNEAESLYRKPAKIRKSTKAKCKLSSCNGRRDTSKVREREGGKRRGARDKAEHVREPAKKVAKRAFRAIEFRLL